MLANSRQMEKNSLKELAVGENGVWYWCYVQNLKHLNEFSEFSVFSSFIVKKECKSFLWGQQLLCDAAML